MSPEGYSGTPLAKKLGFKPGYRCAFVGAPSEFEGLLGALPEGARVLGRPGRGMDLVVLFAKRRRDLEARFEKLSERLAPAGMLWVAWPKQSSGVATDLSDSAVRAHGLEVGLVDTKVCAIDATWSGLKFVVRVADRSARR